MNAIFKKFLIALFSVTSSFSFANIDGYYALPLRYLKENDTKKHYYTDASMLVKSVDIKDDILAVAKKIITVDASTLESLIVEKKSLKRAMKIAKASNLKIADIDKSSTAKVGDYYVLICKLPENSKLKDGMNIFVFEYVDGKLLWNCSFNDLLLTLLATSNIENIKTLEIKTLSESDAEIVGKLKSSDLPILTFGNGVFVSMDKISNVNDLPIAKFYHKAQEIFYNWQLDEYTNYLTKFSKEKFDSQFKEMSQADREKSLGEYFKWKKDYLKVFDAGQNSMIFYKRIKEGDKPYNDFVYLVPAPNNEWAISNFSANKSFLDMFLSKYLLSEDGYYKLMAEKFLK